MDFAIADFYSRGMVMQMKSNLFFGLSVMVALSNLLAQDEPNTVTEPNDEAAKQATGHPFSWPFVGWEKMEPRGGTTRGSEVTLDTEPNAALEKISEEGIEKRERDRRAILALAGDYRVSFDFIEVASSAQTYQPPRPYFSWATERVMVLADEPEFISLQHVLVMEFVDEEGEVKGPFIMKHWRQDWHYEDDRGHVYRGDRRWEAKAFDEADGTWTQAVYQVDDSPRYEVVGEWDHRGGLSVFRTRDFWRPLPRREFSVRDDYNVLAGHHEITLTPRGWLHTQQNRKVVAKGGAIQQVLAQETGAVRYERISAPTLDEAADYWRKAEPFWSRVRSEWVKIWASNEAIELRPRVDEKPMYAALFERAAKFEKHKKGDEERAKILEEIGPVIHRYVKDE